MRVFIYAIAAALAVGCAGAKEVPTGIAAPNTIVAGVVTATRVAGGVQLTNGTERPIAYAVANPSWLGLLATCSDPSPNCLRVKAGGTVTVPLADIYGWTSTTTDAVVYWWQVLPNASGAYQATEVARVEVKL